MRAKLKTETDKGTPATKQIIITDGDKEVARITSSLSLADVSSSEEYSEKETDLLAYVVASFNSCWVDPDKKFTPPVKGGVYTHFKDGKQYVVDSFTKDCENLQLRVNYTSLYDGSSWSRYAHEWSDKVDKDGTKRFTFLTMGKRVMG